MTEQQQLEQAIAVQEGLLVLCVFRPNAEHGSWHLRELAARRYHHRHTDLWLQPLSAGESETLVSNLLGAGFSQAPEESKGVPTRLVDRILDQAEGNPFYVEEVLRSLIDTGAIVRDELGRWQVTQDVADLAIPDTLQGVLVARIDRLQVDTRRVLQLASVIGRVFLYRVLAAIAQEERDLDDKLLALQRHELIRERARIPELEFIFKHELTREAAYNSILKKQRRVFHRQTAEALERLFPDRIEELLGLLAHHWERAEDAGKAIEYLLRAGDQARFAYAHAEAASYYQRGLALLADGRDLDRQARLTLKLGAIYQATGRHAEARTAYDNGFALWREVTSLARARRPSLPPAPHALRFTAEEPDNLSPITIRGGHTWRVLHHLFRGLARWSYIWDSTPLPDVAHSWDVSEDGHRYLFRLRPNVAWSDGAPVTAADFELAWRSRLDPATRAAMAPDLDDIRGAEAFRLGREIDPAWLGVHALDDLTLEVELETSISHFPYLLTGLPFYPIPGHAVARCGDAWTQPQNLVTNGPFRLENWDRGASMTVRLDPTYDGPIYGNVRQVRMLFVRDAKTELAMYEAGDLDCVELSGYSMPELDGLRWRHAEEYQRVDQMDVAFLAFDGAQPPFDDPRVRRAFAHAVNIEFLANEILHGYEPPATGGLIPPGIAGHSPGLVLPYEPTLARELLAQAGFAGGRGFPEVELLLPGAEGAPALIRRSGFNTAIGDYLASQWRATLNVETNVQLVPLEAFYQRLSESVPPIRLLRWGADYPDPDNLLSPILRYNLWRRPDYEQLVVNARTEPRQRERLALHQAAHKLLLDEAVIVPLVYPRKHVLFKPWYRLDETWAQWYWQDFVLLPH